MCTDCVVVKNVSLAYLDINVYLAFELAWTSLTVSLLGIVGQRAVWATLPLVYLVCALNSTLCLYPYPYPSWLASD